MGFADQKISNFWQAVQGFYGEVGRRISAKEFLHLPARPQARSKFPVPFLSVSLFQNASFIG